MQETETQDSEVNISPCEYRVEISRSKLPSEVTSLRTWRVGSGRHVRSYHKSH